MRDPGPPRWPDTTKPEIGRRSMSVSMSGEPYWSEPTAPAEGLDACGHDVVGIRLQGYREGRAEALGDVREFVDESHDRAAAIAREYDR